MSQFKGIVLAGGHGSRLQPATKAVSKQLQIIYDKPMIYYPIDTLMRIGISDLLVVVNNTDIGLFQRLLGDGKEMGIRISYAVQIEARGIADALLIGRNFVGKSHCALILGDNIFCDTEMIVEELKWFTSGATVFVTEVDNPQEFGIVSFESDGRPHAIVEKPNVPVSRHAVTGLYLYDESAFERACRLSASERGEIEITDLNMSYLLDQQLRCGILRGTNCWFDCGTAEGILSAGFALRKYIRQGMSLGYIELSACNAGFISQDQLAENIEKMPESSYKQNLNRLTAGRNNRRDPS